MQLRITTVHSRRLQRALYNLWRAWFLVGQIPFWQSLYCQALGPYLSAICVIGLSASNSSILRIASTQANQLPAHDSRGQKLDGLSALAIKPQFEQLVSQVFAWQPPLSITL